MRKEAKKAKEKESPDKSLSIKHEKFKDEYLSNGFNATKAAIAVGTPENSASEMGCLILRNANVKKAILKEFEKYGDITRKALIESAKIIDSKITDFVEIDNLTGTIKVKPLKDIPEGMTSIIKKIKEKRVIKDNADGTSSTVYDNVEYELYDKQDY